jgi:BASS family bile acid:Na+ symporter
MSGEMLKALALPVALFLVLFGMGLSLTPDDFRRVFRSPRAKVVGLASQLVMLPAVAFLLALAFRLPGELAVGLMVLAACPGGATSNVIAHLARGDTALSVTLTAISSTVCVFTIPWIVGWSMGHFMGADAAVQLPFWRTLGQLFLVTILPIALGMALRHTRPRLAQRMAKPANIFSLVFLAVIIAAAVAREDNLAAQFRLAGPAAVSLNLVTMGLAFLAARAAGLGLPQRITISLEAGIQNGTLALGITLGLLDNPDIAMPSVVYCLFMFASGGLMALWFGRRRVAAP